MKTYTHWGKNKHHPQDCLSTKYIRIQNNRLALTYITRNSVFQDFNGEPSTVVCRCGVHYLKNNSQFYAGTAWNNAFSTTYT